MEKRESKISVIVPVYNVEKYLNRCIDSILSQVYKNIEVILVDDGSTDSSSCICDQYEMMDVRVKVIHKENAGVSSARNSGLEIASGEYCTFVDSDDYIDEDMYLTMMKIAIESDCDIVMCDCVKEGVNIREFYTHNIRQGYYNRQQLETEYFPNLLMMPNVEYPPSISNWLCLFKRQLVNVNDKKMIKSNEKVKNKYCYNQNIRYEEGIRFSEDLLFGAELFYRAKSFYYMKDKYFYHYYMNPKSATHTFAIDKWDDYVKLYMKIVEKFGKCEYYDFSHQIDLVLLFFVYNALGDIINTQQLSRKDKEIRCREIVQNDNVIQMFSRIRILELPIPLKLKVLTAIYKYRIGINFLIGKKQRRTYCDS